VREIEGIFGTILKVPSIRKVSVKAIKYLQV
jgi:hypothetical protein